MKNELWVRQENKLIVGDKDLTWSTIEKSSGVYERNYKIQNLSKGKENESSFRLDTLTNEHEDNVGNEEEYDFIDNDEVNDEDNAILSEVDEGCKAICLMMMIMLNSPDN